MRFSLESVVTVLRGPRDTVLSFCTSHAHIRSTVCRFAQMCVAKIRELRRDASRRTIHVATAAVPIPLPRRCQPLGRKAISPY